MQTANRYASLKNPDDIRAVLGSIDLLVNTGFKLQAAIARSGLERYQYYRLKERLQKLENKEAPAVVRNAGDFISTEETADGTPNNTASATPSATAQRLEA